MTKATTAGHTGPATPLPSGHTPGPHKVEGTNQSTQVGGFHLIWGGGDLLAYVAYKPDALLYAAAPDLLEALQEVRTIITEGAVTGFDPNSGDWAERLFDSQAMSSAAVRKAGGNVQALSRAAIAKALPTSGGSNG